MKSENELLLAVAERFLFHREKAKSDNPVVAEIAKGMCELEICEMWMLTQK